jgi:hypothetical protein
MRMTQLGAEWTKRPRSVLQGRSAAFSNFHPRSGPLLTESDTQHRQPLGPLPWVRLALVAVVNAFSVKLQAKMETKWKHRRIDRRGDHRKCLI